MDLILLVLAALCGCALGLATRDAGSAPSRRESQAHVRAAFLKTAWKSFCARRGFCQGSSTAEGGGLLRRPSLTKDPRLRAILLHAV